MTEAQWAIQKEKNLAEARRVRESRFHFDALVARSTSLTREAQEKRDAQ